MHRRHFTLLVALLAGCIGYVLLTGATLPEGVASHFSASGSADGWMSRGLYLTLPVVALVAMGPIALLTPAIAERPGAALLLPNRAYWLAPQRREATALFLSSQGCRLAGALALLITFAHSQVVEANVRQPPSIHPPRMWLALALLLTWAVAELVLLRIRFRGDA